MGPPGRLLAGLRYGRMVRKPWAIIWTTINDGSHQAITGKRQFECNLRIERPTRAAGGDNELTAFEPIRSG